MWSSTCAPPPGIHAHDGAQQLAALDRMVPPVLPLPPRHRLLHDPALLHQGECGFRRGSHMKSKALELVGGPETAVAPPGRPQDSAFMALVGESALLVERTGVALLPPLPAPFGAGKV